MDRLIYLDNAATTPVDDTVLEAMLPYFTNLYGNPSAVYELAGRSAQAVNKARDMIAESIGARREEIFFTSGGSESDNWAIKSAAQMLKGRGKHVITGAIEHKAVLNSCKWLEKNGYEVTYLDVSANGMIDPEQLSKTIRKDTILVSVMTANNEIGAIQPISQIGQIAHEHGIFFHTDAVSAYGHMYINVKEMNIDMLSASAHKIYGPKGVGFLYVNRDCRLPAFIDGGAQERNKRAGTLNVPGIVGMGEAVRIAHSGLEQRASAEAKIRDYLIERIETLIPGVILTGDRWQRLPNNASFAFKNIDGEALMLMLGREGICVSSGAACSTGQAGISHVLKAIKLAPEYEKGALRLTIGRSTTKNDIDIAVDCIDRIIKQLH